MNNVSNTIYAGDIATSGVIEGPMVVSYDPRNGGNTKRSFTGTPTAINALYISYCLYGWTCELTTGDAMWTLNATIARDYIQYPNSEPIPVDVWELTPQSKTQSILECSDRPTIALLSTKAKEVIESQMKDPASTQLLNYSGSSDYVAAKIVYNLMRVGVDARQTSYPVLRRKIVCSNTYNSNWNTANNGKILKTSTLVSTYAIPNSITQLLPTYSGTLIDSNNVSVCGGWFQAPPNVNTIAANKVEISQEWIYDNAWSSILYDQI